MATGNRNQQGENGRRHERDGLSGEQAVQNVAFISGIMQEIADIAKSAPELEIVAPEKVEPADRDGWTAAITVSGWQTEGFYEDCEPLAYALGRRLGVDVVLKRRILNAASRVRIEALVKKVAETFAGSVVEVATKVFRPQPPKEEGGQDGERPGFVLAVSLKTERDSVGRLVGTRGSNKKLLEDVLGYLADRLGLRGGVEIQIDRKRESVPVSESTTGTLDPNDADTAKSTGPGGPTPPSADA